MSTNAIWYEFREGSAEWRVECLRRFKALWEALVQSDETLKARGLLELAPAVVQDTPDFQRMREFTAYRLRHLGAWDVYRRCYRETPSPIAPTREATMARGAARMAVQWAETLGAEGPPVFGLVIGAGAGFIEEAMLEASPRLHLSLVGVEDGATGARLQDRFGRRLVAAYAPEGMYDWPEGAFDVVIMLEVIEHLPSEVRTMAALRRRLAPDGTLLLSTPNAEYSRNPTVTSLAAQFDWWGHLRAHTPSSLWAMLRREGFIGDLFGVDAGATFFAVLRQAPATQSRPVPAFVSEACVQQLRTMPTDAWIDRVLDLVAESAARTEIVVFAPRPPQPHLIVYAHDNVLWLEPGRLPL